MKLVETSQGNLYIGSKDDVMAVMEEIPQIKFDIIWNLAEELGFLIDDEKLYAKMVLTANIEDYGVPEDKVEFLRQLTLVVNVLRNGGDVLIHCFGGHGRTGIGLAAIKIMLEKLTAEAALIFANNQCNGPETSEQKQFVTSLIG
jgi:protein-tyrosine phosphatase